MSAARHDNPSTPYMPATSNDCSPIPRAHAVYHDMEMPASTIGSSSADVPADCEIMETMPATTESPPVQYVPANSDVMSQLLTPATHAKPTLPHVVKPSAPDGGWGWVVVVVGFVIYVITGSSIYSHGLYLPEMLKAFRASEVKTSLIFSLQAGFTLVTGIVAAVFIDTLGCRVVCFSGIVLYSAGLLIAAMANSLWHLYIGFGIIAGIGLSMQFMSALVAVQQYFSRHRTLATGLATCGTGVGAFCFGQLFPMFLSHLGWRGTLMMQATIAVQCLVLGALLRPLSPGSKYKATNHTSDQITREAEVKDISFGLLANMKRFITRYLNFSVMTDPSILLLLATVAVFAPSYNTSVFLPHRILSLKYTQVQAATLASIIGLADMVGRVVFGFIGSVCCFNKAFILASSLTVIGVTTFLSALVDRYMFLLAYAIVFGLFYGCFSVLFFPIVTETAKPGHLARAISSCLLVEGLVRFSSTFCLALLYDNTHTYTVVFMVMGVYLTVGSMVSFIRIFCVRKTSQRMHSTDKTTLANKERECSATV